MGVLLVVVTDAGSIPVSGIELAPESRRGWAAFPATNQAEKPAWMSADSPVNPRFSHQYAGLRNLPERRYRVLSI